MNDGDFDFSQKKKEPGNLLSWLIVKVHENNTGEDAKAEDIDKADALSVAAIGILGSLFVFGRKSKPGDESK